MTTKIFAVFLLLLSSSAFAAPVIGTMSGAIRQPDQEIDVDRTIDGLAKLGVNTYYYLILQSSQDWAHLPEFADKAAAHGIEVWPYIVPWSETPPKKPLFSEPFKTNYIEWARQIAALSLQHPNIAGFVIDDFYGNTDEDHFTPEYVRRMVGAGKQINPKLKFYPLMYFQTPWDAFTARFGSLVDGVVICYPKSELGVRNAATYLNDQRHGPTAIITLPRHHGANRGDGVSIEASTSSVDRRGTQSVNITDPSNAELTFYYDATDQAESDTSLQIARVRVDDQVVWQSPTEGRMRDGVVDIDLRRIVRHPRRVKIGFDVFCDRTGVPDVLPIEVRFDDIRVYGAPHGDIPFANDLVMHGSLSGKFEAVLMPGSRQTGRFHIPLTLMPSGEGEQYEKRYDLPGTPDAVGLKVRLCLDLMRLGIAEGTVPYSTPLDPRDPMFDAVHRQFAAFRRSK
jgi:hypothetical protein